MKKLSALLVLTVLSLNASAWDEKMPPGVLRLPELCQLETDYGSLLFESQSFDVLNMYNLDAKVLDMVNQHLQTSDYTKIPMTLSEIKQLFAQEYSYDEIHVTFLKHRSSGKQFVYVNSYPGDNEYGLYFSAETGKVAASNGDGSISLNAEHGALSCYSLMGH